MAADIEYRNTLKRNPRDPAVDQCQQKRFEDWTGVDSLAAPLASLIVFVLVQFLERNGPLFNYSEDGVMAPYLKVNQKINEFVDYSSSRNLGIDTSTMSRREILQEMEKHGNVSSSFRLSSKEKKKEGLTSELDDTGKTKASGDGEVPEGAKVDKEVEMS